MSGLRMAKALIDPGPLVLEFTILGAAQQMGSKRAFVPRGWSRPIITDSNRNLKSWQQLVSEGASHAMQQLPPAERRLLLEGVRLIVAFYLPRPKSLPKRQTAHTKAPDLDKFVRALGDALTGVVYRDDAQVVDLVAMKRYAALGEPAHVDVRIESTAGVAALVRDQPLFSGLL